MSDGAGKGSLFRKVDLKKYGENFDNIFSKDLKKEILRKTLLGVLKKLKDVVSRIMYSFLKRIKVIK